MAIFNSYVSLPEGNCFEIKPTNIPRQGLHGFTLHLDMVLIKSSHFSMGESTHGLTQLWLIQGQKT